MYNEIPQYQEAKLRYLQGESLTSISKNLGVDRKKLSVLLKQDNISIRLNNQKHVYNEKFFEKIDTEEKAYWLGFMYADGYVDNFGKHEFSLSLKESDYNHVKKFANTVVLSKPYISKEKSIINNIEFYSYRFNAANKKMVEDLIRLGCVPTKSLILTFPNENIVPKYLQHHFIRGYFDGDGSVMIRTKPYKHIWITIVGTESFLMSIQNILSKNIQGYTYTKLGHKGKAYDYKKGGSLVVKSVFKYLYKDSTIYLERKYQKFIDYYNLNVLPS